VARPLDHRHRVSGLSSRRGSGIPPAVARGRGGARRCRTSGACGLALRPRRPWPCWPAGPHRTGAWSRCPIWTASRADATRLACQAVPDLPLIFREVTPDDGEVELPQDRLLRLALQQEGEARLHKVHGIRRPRSETSEIGSGHVDVVVRLAAVADGEPCTPSRRPRPQR
jgi:hypothetical protein